MAKVAFTPELGKEYEHLFDTMTLSPRATKYDIDRRVAYIRQNRERYKAVQAITGVPWQLIACIHSMEAGGRFDRHLHNGDPLTARTKMVPKGMPKADPKAGPGKPYTWEESARDALLNVKGLGSVKDWTLGRMLYTLESFNGFGYRIYHPGVKSPYLWSMTNHYTKGKYVADGKWDSNAISKQIGAACLLKPLMSVDKFESVLIAKAAEQEAKEQS